MAHKVTCKHCGRYLFNAVKSMVVEGVVCPNSKCKAKLNIKVLFLSDTSHELEGYSFTEPEQPPRH